LYGELIAFAAMLAIVIGGLIHQRHAGLFGAGAFAAAPPRAGTLGVHDIAITVGLWLIGMMVGGVVGLQIVGDDKAPESMLVLTACGQGGALLAVVYVYLRAQIAMDAGVRGIGLVGPILGQSLKQTIAVMVFIIPATFVSLATMALLTEAIGYPPPKLAHPMLESIQDADSTSVIVGLLVLPIVVAPFFEETIFRGMMHTALLHAAALSRWMIVVVASAIFAVIHLPAVPWQSIPALFVLALGLGYAYERTGKLWAPMLIHAVFNALNVTLVLTGVVNE
jgi:membrane protease YdiL (CAAX protease family)